VAWKRRENLDKKRGRAGKEETAETEGGGAGNEGKAGIEGEEN
jgi:hypothetical protein